jgi:hypothetical protein
VLEARKVFIYMYMYMRILTGDPLMAPRNDKSP